MVGLCWNFWPVYGRLEGAKSSCSPRNNNFTVESMVAFSGGECFCCWMAANNLVCFSLRLLSTTIGLFLWEPLCKNMTSCPHKIISDALMSELDKICCYVHFLPSALYSLRVCYFHESIPSLTMLIFRDILLCLGDESRPGETIFQARANRKGFVWRSLQRVQFRFPVIFINHKQVCFTYQHCEFIHDSLI